jgi:regulator of sigma E protease
MSFLITFFGLGFIIFFHELGHMLIAKFCGVYIYEFSVGMGPAIYQKKYGQTKYAIRVFPFGGFVKLAGMDDEEEDEHAQQVAPDQSFYAKSFGQKIAIISAGSLMNIFLGFLFFLVIYCGLGVSEVSNKIIKIVPDSIADTAGLQVGDQIVRVNNQKVKDANDDIIKIINKNAQKTVQLTYQRNQDFLKTTVIPELDKKDNKARIGIALEIKHYRHNIVSGTIKASQSTWGIVKLVFTSLKLLINRKVGLENMAGPIGIVQLASFGLKQGATFFLDIMAMITISLGVINLFPIPVLDGGHLVILSIEAYRKERLPEKFDTLIKNIGAALLITLMAFVVINDILHWHQRIDILKTLAGN